MNSSNFVTLEKNMDAMPERKIGTIDVENVLRSKNPSLAKAIPKFLINYIKRVIHQDEVNVFLEKYAYSRDAELVSAFLQHFNIKYSSTGLGNIPAQGRFIFVSNHPLGGLDGVVFINQLSKIFPDIKFPVNDILTYIENLSGIFLPVNKHGSQGREAARRIEEAYASPDAQILYFPAGLCSRKRNGVIKDLPWHKSFVAKSVQYKRDIVPAYFSGRNSNFFYNLANARKFLGIKANIEMLYLPDEMFRQIGLELKLTFGKPIPWKTFDSKKSYPDWAEWVKQECYNLEKNL